jgi:ComF family protein
MPSTGVNLSGQVRGLAGAILDLLFPPRCAVCKRVGGDQLCSACLAEFVPVGDATCPVCGDLHSGACLCWRCRDERPAFSRVQSGFRFEGRVRQAVHALKYRKGEMLAAPLAGALAEVVPAPASFVLCAVPLHAARQAERGYNQAGLLTDELVRLWGMPRLPPAALKRIRPTDSQVGQDYAARRENVRGAFAACSELVRDHRVLLIDDVCTTGATMNACAGALLAAGAGSVAGVTLARAI